MLNRTAVSGALWNAYISLCSACGWRDVMPALRKTQLRNVHRDIIITKGM